MAWLRVGLRVAGVASVPLRHETSLSVTAAVQPERLARLLMTLPALGRIPVAAGARAQTETSPDELRQRQTHAGSMMLRLSRIGSLLNRRLLCMVLL